MNKGKCTMDDCKHEKIKCDECLLQDDIYSLIWFSEYEPIEVENEERV